MMPRGSPRQRLRGPPDEPAWQAQLERDPVARADHHGRVGDDGLGHRLGARLDRLEGILALSLARVADIRRPQAYRRDVYRAGPAHAAARLLRRDHDAGAA